jgi:hypothetical protein
MGGSRDFKDRVAHRCKVGCIVVAQPDLLDREIGWNAVLGRSGGPFGGRFGGGIGREGLGDGLQHTVELALL